MINEEFVEFYKERGSGALDQKMGIKILEAEQGRIVGTMPVEGNTQPMGLLHGGASVVLAESLGSCLLYTSPSPQDQRGYRMPSSA